MNHTPFRSRLFLCLLLVGSAFAFADDSPGETSPGAAGPTAQVPSPAPPPNPDARPPAKTNDGPATSPAPDAATEAPKALQGRQAEVMYNAQMQKFVAEYTVKAAAIKQPYIDELKRELRAIASSDNPDTDEIAKLSAKIKSVQANGVQNQLGNVQLKQISGKWRDTWDGGFCDFIFNKDKTLSNASDNVSGGTWVQDGMTVIVLSENRAHSYDKLTLSDDGNTMSGISSASGQTVTYTYLGD
jgi:hypothetical protein